MVLIGVSILIVSLSILCYRHPPSAWTFFMSFFHQGLLKHPNTERARVLPDTNALSQEEDAQKAEAHVRASLDRMAMPPPPQPPSLTVSSSSTASIVPTISSTRPTSCSSLPSFTTKEAPALSSSPPTFPAQNSIQRASGGRVPPLFNPLPAAQSPLRSINSLMPLPSRGPLPNRSPVLLAPPPSLSGIPAKPRMKVQLSPGHSPLDWAHLSNRADVNLRGLPPSTPYLRVPQSLLRQYTGRKGKDAWTVLGGKVYNITPYLPYHPGGEPELMKAAGRDGTKLFGEVHPWVNWENMLEPCLIGVANGQEEITDKSTLEDMD